MTNLPTQTPDIVLCGNFNLLHLTWPEGTLRPGSSRDEQIMAKDLKDLTHEHLFQKITGPTHRQGNSLDLCFSNNLAFVYSYQCCRSLFFDHYIVEGRSTYSKFPTPQSYPQLHSSVEPGAEFDKLNFMSDEADWDSLERDLDAQDWNTTLAGLDPGEMLTKPLKTCASISHVALSEKEVTERLVEYLTCIEFLCAGDVKWINRCPAPKTTPRRTNLWQKQRTLRKSCRNHTTMRNQKWSIKQYQPLRRTANISIATLKNTARSQLCLDLSYTKQVRLGQVPWRWHTCLQTSTALSSINQRNPC